MIKDPLLVLAFLLIAVAFTRWLEESYEWVKTISSAVLCTLLGIVLANTDLLLGPGRSVIEHTGPMQEAIFTFAIPYAIVLIIMGTNMRELANAGRPMLIAYGAACFGSLVAGVVAGVAMASWVGPETSKLAGAFSAAFAGGGINFAAVGGPGGLDIDESTFVAAQLADNLSTVPYFLAQVGMVGILSATFIKRSGLPPKDLVTSETGEPIDEESMRRRWTDTELNITDLAILGALPLLALWCARTLGQFEPISIIPEVLWLTTIALIVAQIPVMRKLRGTEVISYFALHIFFIVLGAAAELSEVASAGLPIFSFMILILAIHVVVAYGIGWLAKVDLGSVTIA
ncbi:MAG: DUF819 family protein, partial [Gemmatimonadetes bacterium]|nr:DUF819 family protein [Gemmatimonadota bacterium]